MSNKNSNSVVTRYLQKNSNEHLQIGLWITFLSVNKTWKLQPHIVTFPLTHHAH